MTKKLLPLVIMTLLSATSYAATPPDTLVVAQGLDDIVSLDPAEANELQYPDRTQPV
jgi:peptide/nickel transport system substrate-binding protein